MSEQFLRCIQEKHTSGSLKPNELDHSGLSLVHQAAKDGQLTCLKWLMKFGGDLEVKSSEDLAPAHYAAGEGHLQILQYIHERKRESISIKSQSNVTPLYLAAQEGQLDCLIWLTKSSAVSPDTQVDNGMTPSHVASQEGRMECLRYLIKAAHAQIKTVDIYGCGVLHYAAAEGHWKIVKWLINHCGISWEERDYSGAIALHVAAGGGHENVIHMLIKCGAVLHSEDYEGKTALDYAIQNKQRSCVEVIRNMMFRPPEDLRNLKKVRFNELVYTYDLRSPRYKCTSNANVKKASSDYWDEVIQSQFDYWRNSPQQTKRQRQLKEKRKFYKGRSNILNSTKKQEHVVANGESTTKINKKINTNFKDPPDLLKHLNEKNLDRLNITTNGTATTATTTTDKHKSISCVVVPPVPARKSSGSTVPPPVPVRLSSTGKTPPVVPKRTGVPKFPHGTSQDTRTLESRGYRIKRAQLNTTTTTTTSSSSSKTTPSEAHRVTDAPIENSTPAHSPPIEISFRSHQHHTTQNPLYRDHQYIKYGPTTTPNNNTSTNKTHRRRGENRGHVNRLVNQYDSIAHQDLYTYTNDTNSYLPFSYLGYRSTPKVKLKECNSDVRSNSSKDGRLGVNLDMAYSQTSSSFDHHLHDISMNQFTDRNKIKFFSRNLSKPKQSTWTSIRNGVTSFFNSICPKRDQTGRATWSDPRYSQREDIFSRFSLPRKASRKEFDDLFNHSIEGNYTLSKNNSFNSLASNGRFVTSNPSMEENKIGNSMGTSPYDRFLSRENKDSLSGYSDFSVDIQGSPNSFESFLNEPPITSTMRRVRKEKGHNTK